MIAQRVKIQHVNSEKFLYSVKLFYWGTLFYSGTILYSYNYIYTIFIFTDIFIIRGIFIFSDIFIFRVFFISKDFYPYIERKKWIKRLFTKAFIKLEKPSYFKNNHSIIILLSLLLTLIRFQTLIWCYQCFPWIGKSQFGFNQWCSEE